jgi:predicted ferric reductase
MSRIPWLERRIGSEWVAAVHRALGGYLVSMLVAHSALIVAGYAVTAQVGMASETVRVVLDEPDVLMATVALALLVGVGWLSARAVRRRLAYETWYYLHLYAYLAVLLAFAHQLAVGAEFTDDRIARVVWAGAHLAVAACLLTFRVGGPLRLAMRHRMRVAAVRREAPGIVSVYVTGRDLGRLRVEAGQFFRWRFLTAGAGGRRTVLAVRRAEWALPTADRQGIGRPLSRAWAGSARCARARRRDRTGRSRRRFGGAVGCCCLPVASGWRRCAR